MWSELRLGLVPVLWCVLCPGITVAQEDDDKSDNQTRDFASYFSECKRGESGFDDCIKDALNAVRPFFKTGVPDLKIPPFDPFFAKEIVQRRGGFAINYRLVLRNVQERGWTESEVTSFRSDPVLNLVQYTQFFPEKWLEGEYEGSSQILLSPPDNRGVWNLTLYNLVQTTTISRPKNSDKLKVRVDVQKIGNMNIHISNLLRGRTFMENVLDRIINASWRAGFPMLRPLINDLVSTAFTEIFNDAFNDLEMNEILPS
ncbi:uncharacterized protein LOC124363881 [Homalodisca vitripennis]|uniref:uncharacterized protein LOC124363881 n=1 Tax=Homalodisca vitripennis TaxID=197043 RepID=UPI001EEAA6C8|nr:uncharacterized protein LOC124363881 [Homalodisca vitripennis]